MGDRLQLFVNGMIMMFVIMMLYNIVKDEMKSDEPKFGTETHLYLEEKCDRCGGIGYIYSEDNGIKVRCNKCVGSGIVKKPIIYDTVYIRECVKE